MRMTTGKSEVRLFSVLPGGVLLLFIFSFFACHSVTYQDFNHPQLVDSLLKQADRLRKISNPEQAQNFLDSAYHQLPEAGVMDRYRKYAWLMTSNVQSQPKADYVKADLYVDSLFGLFDRKKVRTKYPKEYALLHLYRADIQQFQKKYEEAYRNYFQGKLLMEAVEKCETNQYTARIASMNFEQKNFAKAASFYKQSYKQLGECKDKTDFDTQIMNRQGCLSNAAFSYIALGKLDSATYLYDQALQFIQQNEPNYPLKKEIIAMAKGVIYGNLGAVYYKKGDFNRAIPVLRESVRINSQKGYYNYDAQFALIKLLEVYIASNQLGKAQEVIRDLEAWLKELPSNTAYLRLYNVKWQYWEKVNQLGKSQQDLKKYLALKEITEQDARTFDGMDQALLKLENEHKIELLKKKQELQYLYLIGTIVASLMALVIALLIWLSWRRAKQNLVKSTALNQTIRDRNSQLEMTLLELEKSQHENAQLLNFVVQDLRTPVGFVIMAVDTLLEGNLNSQKPHVFLKRIQNSSTNALALIDSLLHSTINLDKKMVDVSEFLASCVDILQLKARQKRQSIHLQNEVVYVNMDRQKMWRVLDNLITNAIKFSPTDSTISIQVIRLVKTVQFVIKDQGMGIPVQLKEKGFDSFTETNRPGTAGEKTVGLGLSISRQIVEAHHGKLWFESKENQGTRFYIELPIQ